MTTLFEQAETRRLPLADIRREEVEQCLKNAT